MYNNTEEKICGKCQYKKRRYGINAKETKLHPPEASTRPSTIVESHSL